MIYASISKKLLFIFRNVPKKRYTLSIKKPPSNFISSRSTPFDVSTTQKENQMGLALHKENEKNIQEIVLEHMNIVHQEVRKLFPRGAIQNDYNDMVQIGVIGLIEAANRFDAQRCRSFAVYARIRIQGAIIDEMRKQDWVPRSVRQRAAQLKDSISYLTTTLGRKPSIKEICNYIGITEDKFATFCVHSEIAPLLSLEDGGEFPIRNQISYEEETVQERVINKEQKQILATLIKELNEQEQKIVQLYYFEDMNMKEIASFFGVSESRISQIHHKIKKHLAIKLRRWQ